MKLEEKHRRLKTKSRLPIGPAELIVLILLAIFCIYVIIGALLLPLLNGKVSRFHFFVCFFNYYFCVIIVDDNDPTLSQLYLYLKEGTLLVKTVFAL